MPGELDTCIVYSSVELGTLTISTYESELPPAFLQISMLVTWLPLSNTDEYRRRVTDVAEAVIKSGAGGLDGTVAALM
jgi:hypothetical protein